MSEKFQTIKVEDYFLGRQITFNSHAAIELRLQIGLDRSFLLTKRVMGVPGAKEESIRFFDLDVDGLIDMLQKAKHDIDQRNVFNKLSKK